MLGNDFMIVVTIIRIILWCFVLVGSCSGSLMYIGAVGSFVDSGIMVDGLAISVLDSLSCVVDNGWLGNNNATGADVCLLFDICVMSKGKLLWLLIGLEVELVVFLIIMVFVAVLRADSVTSMNGSRSVAVSEAVNVTGAIAVVVGVWSISGTVGTISKRLVIGVRSMRKIVRMRTSEGMVSIISISIVDWVRDIAVAIGSTWVVISSTEDVMFGVIEIVIITTITVTSFTSHAVDSRNFCVVISSIERSHAMVVLIRSVLSSDMRAAFPSISGGRVRNAWSWSNLRSAEVGDVAFGIEKIVVAREVMKRSLASYSAVSGLIRGWLLMPFDASA